MGSKQTQMEAIKRAYVEWCRYPNLAARKAAGVYTSKGAFAEAYGVDRSTLYHWEQDPDFKRAVADQNLRSLSTDELSRILAALKAKAYQGNVQAAKLLLEWTGLYGRNAVGEEVPADEDDKFDAMTDEELEAFLDSQKAAREQLREII